LGSKFTFKARDGWITENTLGMRFSVYVCGRKLLDIQNVDIFDMITATFIKSLRHREFPGGPPSKYYPGPTMLNFRDQTRTGVFIVVWS
jgi:hypothetical protein